MKIEILKILEKNYAQIIQEFFIVILNTKSNQIFFKKTQLLSASGVLFKGCALVDIMNHKTDRLNQSLLLNKSITSVEVVLTIFLKVSNLGWSEKCSSYLL